MYLLVFLPIPPKKENESKRNRAVKRAGDERKQREQKEQEIVKLKKQCKERQDEEARLRRDLEEHRRYHDFLAQVRWCGAAGGASWCVFEVGLFVYGPEDPGEALECYEGSCRNVGG